jgi:hypothetical protein
MIFIKKNIIKIIFENGKVRGRVNIESAKVRRGESVIRTVIKTLFSYAHFLTFSICLQKRQSK